MVHHLRVGKSDCDAHKADVGSQSANTIKFCFRSHRLANHHPAWKKETAPALGPAEAVFTRLCQTGNLAWF
jgi:hypothetical protein